MNTKHQTTMIVQRTSWSEVKAGDTILNFQRQPFTVESIGAAGKPGWLKVVFTDGQRTSVWCTWTTDTIQS